MSLRNRGLRSRLSRAIQGLSPEPILGVPRPWLASLDTAHGLDFATWMPLSLMYSSGKVPIVQLSLPAGGAPADMMAVGKALAPLRQAGIMRRTGSTVCNPHRVGANGASVESWALAFDEWVSERLDALDVDALAEYRRRAPHAHLSAPTADFLDPRP